MFSALVAMRDRYAEERRQHQMQSCDSGMGTSVGDSESEAESLNEQAQQGANEREQVSGNNSSEDGEERIYNYGQECDEEQEDSSSSSDDDDKEEEEDDFMKDRQINEDYSAYRERIFDFTPKGYQQKKSLVEEIREEETPSTSGITEVPTTSNTETKNVEIQKQNVRSEDSFNFQMLVQHMSKAEGIKIDVKETKEKQEDQSSTTMSDGDDIKNRQDATINQYSDVETDEDDVEKTKKYMETHRKILVGQATEQVKKLDVTSLTFEEYMTSFDKPPVKKENADCNSEDMTKNIGQGSSTNENNENANNSNKALKNKTLKDIILENNVIDGGSDSDDTDVSEDEERNSSTVSEKGDGPSLYRLKKSEDIEDAIKENSIEIKHDVDIESKESSIQNEETEENISTAGYDNDVPINISESEDLLVDETKEESAENISRHSDSEESNDSSDDEEKPYYEKLDKSESTELKTIDENAAEISAAKSKHEIKEELTTDDQTKKQEDEDDSYREMLTWKLKVPDQNVQILLPIQRKKPENEFKDELCELLAQTTKQEKPEFEITPPKDIAEESDTILYARNTKESICCKYESTYTLRGKPVEVKPPLVHNVLKLSQNYPIFQKAQDEVVTTEVEEEEKPPENALIVSNKISEVRVQMAQFTKNLEEFNERSRLARQEVIDDYNSAVERELKIVDKLMAMRQDMFEKKLTAPPVTNRRVGYIDKNVLRKHFEDMDMIVEEESDSEEELKAAMERINKKVFKDMDLGRQRTNEGDEEEYVLSTVTMEENSEHESEEKEKQDESKEYSGEGIVLIDSESYEEYLTTNEEDEEYEDVAKDAGINEAKQQKDDDNSRERNNESCEEYFTTNEEDFEEYFEASNVNQDPSDVSYEEPINYQQFINKLRKRNEDDASEDEEREDENYKEAVASQYNEKEKDEKGTADVEDLVKCEGCPVVKRNVNCSLEMQLAKKADGEV